MNPASEIETWLLENQSNGGVIYFDDTTQLFTFQTEDKFGLKVVREERLLDALKMWNDTLGGDVK